MYNIVTSIVLVKLAITDRWILMIRVLNKSKIKQSVCIANRFGAHSINWARFILIEYSMDSFPHQITLCSRAQSSLHSPADIVVATEINMMSLSWAVYKFIRNVSAQANALSALTNTLALLNDAFFCGSIFLLFVYCSSHVDRACFVFGAVFDSFAFVQFAYSFLIKRQPL